jgi:hypothetical protein
MPPRGRAKRKRNAAETDDDQPAVLSDVEDAPQPTAGSSGARSATRRRIGEGGSDEPLALYDLTTFAAVWSSDMLDAFKEVVSDLKMSLLAQGVLVKFVEKWRAREAVQDLEDGQDVRENSFLDSRLTSHPCRS